MRHRLSLLILCAAASACTSSGTTRSAAAGTTSTAGPPSFLPPTPLVMLDGSSTDLPAIVRGRAAIVTFWATWCDGCLTEIEALKRLDAQTSARGDSLVVGVAVGEPRATVAAFARSRGLGYARWVDEDFHLADAVGEHRVPATLVIDRDGRIVYRGGALDEVGLAAFRGVVATGVAMEARGADLR